MSAEAKFRYRHPWQRIRHLRRLRRRKQSDITLQSDRTALRFNGADEADILADESNVDSSDNGFPPIEVGDEDTTLSRVKLDPPVRLLLTPDELSTLCRANDLVRPWPYIFVLTGPSSCLFIRHHRPLLPFPPPSSPFSDRKLGLLSRRINVFHCSSVCHVRMLQIQSVQRSYSCSGSQSVQHNFICCPCVRQNRILHSHDHRTLCWSICISAPKLMALSCCYHLLYSAFFARGLAAVGFVDTRSWVICFQVRSCLEIRSRYHSANP